MPNKKYILVIISFISLYSCQHKSTTEMSNLQTYAIRLKPGADLKKSIQSYITDKKIHAAWLVTCVGSLTDYGIRFANQPTAGKGTGHFEIVSLTGTLSDNGSHLHLSISDSTGKTIGGHLQEGCIVYTTAEIIIQSSNKFVFKRKKDGTTAWEELQVEEN
ncbi:hypothetical protein BH11BAC4_BH11BAC4_13970 [soil metagenome]